MLTINAGTKSPVCNLQMQSIHSLALDNIHCMHAQSVTQCYICKKSSWSYETCFYSQPTNL